VEKAGNYIVRTILVILLLFFSLTWQPSYALANTDAEMKELNDLAGRYLETDPSKTIVYGKKALNLATSLKDEKTQVDGLRNIGLGYKQLGRWDLDYNYFEQSLKLARKIDYQRGIANALNSLGNRSYDLASYNSALNYHLQALDIREQIDDLTGKSKSLNNIGRTYTKLGEYQKALKFLKESLALKRKLADQGGIINTLNNLGIVHRELKQYQEAQQVFFEALDMARTVGYRQGEGYSLDNIGRIYCLLKKPQKALKYHLDSLRMYQQINYKQGMIYALYNTGSTYEVLGDYNNALKYYQASLVLTKEIQEKFMMKDNYRALANLHARMGNYQEAFTFHQHYSDLQERILKAQIIEQTAGIQARYEAEKRKKEIEVLKKDAAIRELLLNRQRILLYSGIIILSLISLLLYHMRREIKERKFREEQLLDLSQVDGLTGVANRRYFDQVWQREYKAAKLTNCPLSLIFIDLDFYKSYNDTYGHLQGDKCLKLVAAALKQTVRQGDLVARYGGEEFAIILPNLSSAEALKLAERLRQKVEELSLEHAKSEVSNYVSISVGVASTDLGQECDPNSLIVRADQALYWAKNSGRNQVKIFQPGLLN